MLVDITRELIRHFKDSIGPSDFEFFTEPMVRDYSKDWVELRQFNGTIQHLSKIDRRYTVDVSVLVAVVDPVNGYRLEVGKTLVSNLLSTPIPIPGHECLEPRGDVRLTNFGQVEPDVAIWQAMARQTYKLDVRHPLGEP
jgi:hypothetical protein